MQEMTSGAKPCFRASFSPLMPRFRTAFTIMELLLAIALAVIIMALAIPILGSMFGDDSLQDSFKKFEAFVMKAQTKAIKERRTILLVWHEADARHEAGLTIEPEILTAEDADVDPEGFGFGDAEVKLERPFALEKKPFAEWPFWKSGTCEPVRVEYSSEDGRWLAEFDPLTARGTILEMDNR
jgi:hypothetical protein